MKLIYFYADDNSDAVDTENGSNHSNIPKEAKDHERLLKS